MGAWDSMSDDAAADAIAAWNVADHAMIETMAGMVKPVVVAVSGAAAGAGCDMTLTGDIRFVSSKAKFLEAHVKVGYPPDVGGSWLLPRVVGMPKAKHMIMTGDTVLPDDAYSIGFSDVVCEPDNLMAAAMAFATKLAGGATVSLVSAQHILHTTWFIGFPVALSHLLSSGHRCALT